MSLSQLQSRKLYIIELDSGGEQWIGRNFEGNENLRYQLGICFEELGRI
jgi:hypothetical protein